MKRAFLLALLCAAVTGEIHAQLPHNFALVARGGEVGDVKDVTVAADGTVFTVDQHRGLSAYRFEGGEFVLLGRIPLVGDPYHGSDPVRVMVLSDGTVIVIDGYLGMTAFQFENGVFTLVAELQMERYVTGETVDDSDRIYVQRSGVGLLVFRLEGDHFVEVFRAGSGYTDLTIGPDGTVYSISTIDDSLRTFHWVNSALVEQTRSKIYGGSSSVAVSSDGTVFITQGYIGAIHVYLPDSSGYSHYQRYELGYAGSVKMGHDGRVLVACAGYGLRVCSFDNRYLRIVDEDNVGGYTRSLAIGSDGTVFVAARAGGLAAYEYDDTALRRLGVTAIGGEANTVAVADDGTVFLGCESGGLRALRREGNAFNRIAYVNDCHSVTNVAVGPNGTVYIANGTCSKKDFCAVRAYHFDGTAFLPAGHSSVVEDEPKGARAVAVSDSGHIFLAGGYDGVRAYIHQDTNLICTAWKKTYPSFITAIAVDSAHNVFFTQNTEWYDQTSTRGLFSCRYDGFGFSSFVQEFRNDDRNGIAIGNDHTVFLADGSSGLRAYGWDGHAFTERARAEDVFSTAVAVGADGTVFTACSSHGLYAFRFTGMELINTAHVETAEDALDVAVGADGLVYVAAGFEGVLAYRYSGTVGIDTLAQQLSVAMRLEPAFPNPCRGNTIIPYTLDRTAWIRITVSDLLGRRVGIVFEGWQSAGRHTAIFDGRALQRGTYFYRMETEEGISDTRMLTVMHH